MASNKGALQIDPSCIIGPLCGSLGAVRVARASARSGEADGKEGAGNDSGEGISPGGRAHQLHHATRE